MSTYVAESGHWYNSAGEPAYTIVGKNGKERKTTLRDARSHKLVPSVTSILGVAAKPALENWKIDQAIKAAMNYHQGPDEGDTEYLYRIKSTAKEESMQAAARGTEIHADIEKGYLAGPGTQEQMVQAFKSVQYILEGLFPHETWSAERSFTSVLGYGGKIDLYSESGIVVDFKTKDDLEGKDPAKLVYDEHGMQLSAYAQGLGFTTPTRVSIFIDRQDPSIALHHVWDEESHSKHMLMFNHLLQYWQLSKNFDSSLGETHELRT